MTWRIEITAHATRDLRDLDPPVAERIVRRLAAIQGDPLRALKRLKGRSDWCLRVGDWRAVCEVRASSKTMVVVRVQHRSVVYG